MAYQLTIHSDGVSGQADTVRPANLEYETLPADVPACGLRLEETGLPGEIRVVVLPDAPSTPVRCGDTLLSAGESAVMPLGRPVSGDGWWLQLRRLRRRAPVSRRAKLLGKVAAAGAAMLMVAQLFVSLGFPLACRHGDFWRRQREVQEIFTAADRVQRRLERLQTKDGVTTAYVEALRGEMTARRAFLREKALYMRPSLRRQMLDNLQRTEALLLRIEARGKDGFMPPLPALSIDEPVENIIHEHTN